MANTKEKQDYKCTQSSKMLVDAAVQHKAQVKVKKSFQLIEIRKLSVVWRGSTLKTCLEEVLRIWLRKILAKR